MSALPLSAAPGTVRFAQASDGVQLAYRTAGPAGAPAVVLVPGFASHVDAIWEAPPAPGAFLARLAERLHVIVYDRRGQGRSDASAPPSVARDAADVGAVLDAAGVARAAVVGQSQGGAAAIAFAASAPGRVAGLVLVAAYARAARGDGYPHGRPHEQLEAFATAIAARWGDPELAALFAPSAAADPAFADWWTRSSQLALTAPAAETSLRRRAALDVRAQAAALAVPALVVHRSGDVICPVAHGRWLAANVPGARLLELPGDDHLWWLPDPAEVADPILDFVTEVTR